MREKDEITGLFRSRLSGTDGTRRLLGAVAGRRGIFGCRPEESGCSFS